MIGNHGRCRRIAFVLRFPWLFEPILQDTKKGRAVSDPAFGLINRKDESGEEPVYLSRQSHQNLWPPLELLCLSLRALIFCIIVCHSTFAAVHLSTFFSWFVMSPSL